MIALLTMILASSLKFWGIGFWPAILLTLILGAGIGRSTASSPRTAEFLLSLPRWRV